MMQKSFKDNWNPGILVYSYESTEQELSNKYHYDRL